MTTAGSEEFSIDVVRELKGVYNTASVSIYRGGSGTFEIDIRSESDINISSTEGPAIITIEHAYVVMPNIPTSNAGLPQGALWSDGGVLNIVE